MPNRSPTPFERYLARVLAQLRALEPAQRRAVLAELWAHLDDTAAAEGCSPDDPALQQLVIARLGPARRVGRELAEAHGAPAPAAWLLLLGGLGALLVPLIVLGAMLLPEQYEDLDDLLILCAQAPVLLAVPVFYVCWRPIAPRLSLVALVIGLGGGILLPMMVLAALLAPQTAASWRLPPALGAAWFGMTGLWGMLVGAIGLTRYRAQYRRAEGLEPLVYPAVVGLVSGGAWVLLTIGIMFHSARTSLTWLVAPAGLVWGILHLTWSAALGVALWSLWRRGREPLDLTRQPHHP